VTFNTQAMASTDTPTTLLRWLLQQIRWARATLIESFQYPSIYSIHGPVIFLTAVSGFYGPLLTGILTIRYVLTGHVVRTYSVLDIACRIFLCTAYNLACNRKNVNSILHLIWSQIFYQLPLPGIIFWSGLTFLEGSWGTRMRSHGERRKGNAWWEKLWGTTAVVVWMGFVGAGLARYIASTWVPQRQVEMMVLSAASVVATLYYYLLK
jgi:hyaluronan synthase